MSKAGKSKEDDLTVVEFEQRLRATLKGAFSGRPTPLKEMRKDATKKKKAIAKRIDR